jgi:oxalate decarboxylase/phosphoglucose isomerase-like protein (cupin superfamily)
MTDKKEKAIRLGQKAKTLLEDEAFAAAFGVVEQLFVDRWKNSKDAAERDRCWMAINITGHVKTALVTFVSNGKISQQDLDAILSKAA